MYATPESCAAAVAQDGRRLWQVPEHFVTDELCRIAVAQNGMALCYTPEHFRTPRLCTVAVKQNGMALCAVPWRLRTTRRCAIAVLDDARALHWVPYRLRTDALEALVGEAIACHDDTLYRRPNGLYQASCHKHLTLAQALAHWGPPRRDKRARVFHAALLEEQQRLAAQGQSENSPGLKG